MSTITSLNTSFDNYYDLQCQTLSEETYPDATEENPEGDPVAQMREWGMDGINDQMQEGKKIQQKTQQQTENVINS